MAKPDPTILEFIRKWWRYDPQTGLVLWRAKAPKSRRVAGDVVGFISSQGYRVARVKRKEIKLHRVAWFLHYGEWPALQVDHINRDRADNRIENLRLATNQENARNKGQSGLRRPSWNRKKWEARITHNYKTIPLGSYDCFAHALRARRAAEAKYWGAS